MIKSGTNVVSLSCCSGSQLKLTGLIGTDKLRYSTVAVWWNVVYCCAPIFIMQSWFRIGSAEEYSTEDDICGVVCSLVVCYPLRTSEYVWSGLTLVWGALKKSFTGPVFTIGLHEFFEYFYLKFWQRNSYVAYCNEWANCKQQAFYCCRQAMVSSFPSQRTFGSYGPGTAFRIFHPNGWSVEQTIVGSPNQFAVLTLILCACMSRSFFVVKLVNMKDCLFLYR